MEGIKCKSTPLNALSQRLLETIYRSNLEYRDTCLAYRLPLLFLFATPNLANLEALISQTIPLLPEAYSSQQYILWYPLWQTPLQI